MRPPMLKRVSSYEELWSQVDYDRLEIPAQFNLGVACADDNDLEARALTVVSRDQTSHGYTFGDVREQANRLANAVIALGIGRGDVVGVVNPRSFETGVAYMALFRMGGGRPATVVPGYWQQPEETEKALGGGPRGRTSP